MKRDIVLIAHNIRSCGNIGSIFRTCEGMGVKKLLITGYSPYPKQKNDKRLPHISEKLTRQIEKTALGATENQEWQYVKEIMPIIKKLKEQNYMVVALEQTKDAINLVNYKAPNRIAIVVGREVEGIEPEILHIVDQTIEIPMQGKKESFNVAVASAIALYQLTYI